MDLVDGLPNFADKDVIYVVVDRLTKYAHLVALKHPYTAARVAQAVTENVFMLYRLPLVIVSDRDLAFTSNFWS